VDIGGPVLVQHFGAVGDGVTDDRAAFVAADAAGGTVLVPVPPASYTFSSAYTATNAKFKFDPAGTWAALTGGGDFVATLDFFEGDTKGVAVERFPGRVFIGSGAALTTGEQVPGANKSWLGAEAGGFMTYFESRAQLSVAQTIGGLAIAAGSRTSDNVRIGEKAAIGVAAYSHNDNTDTGNKKSSWAFYGHAVNTQDNQFTTSIELDTCSTTTLQTVSPYEMGATGTTAAAWIGVGGETAQELVAAGSGATLTNVSVAIGIVNSAKTAASNRFNKGLVFAANALEGTDGAGTGTASAIEFARGHEAIWKNGNGINNRTGTIRGEGSSSVTQTRLIFENAQFSVKGVQSDLTTENTLFTVIAPTAGAADVNRLAINPGISGSGRVTLSAAGVDTDIDFRVLPKGAGLLRLGYSSTAASVPGSFSANRYIPIKDDTGTTYYIPLMGSTW
jgi:hypothetical protein